MEFFNNITNDNLKFKLDSDGINLDDIEARLILTTEENKNYFFIGKLDGDVCKFNIPELNLYDKGDEGKIKFEIISEDLYFPVWEDNFKIKSKATIKIEEMVSEVVKQSKPQISSTVIVEKNKQDKQILKQEKKIPEKEQFVQKEKQDSFLKKQDYNKKEKFEQKINNDDQKFGIKRFDSFLNE